MRCSNVGLNVCGTDQVASGSGVGMAVWLASINWQAVAAIATLAAVVVALLPIYREALRRNAQARSLRIRISSQLTALRPSLGAVVQRGTTSHPAAVLSRKAFQEAIRSLAGMMQESSVLKRDEQDHLGVVLANIQMTALLYETPELKGDSAQNVLGLIDNALAIMGEHGLLHGRVKKPWEE